MSQIYLATKVKEKIPSLIAFENNHSPRLNFSEALLLHFLVFQLYLVRYFLFEYCSFLVLVSFGEERRTVVVIMHVNGDDVEHYLLDQNVEHDHRRETDSEAGVPHQVLHTFE